MWVCRVHSDTSKGEYQMAFKDRAVDYVHTQVVEGKI
jgi:hypothetical protein